MICRDCKKENECRYRFNGDELCLECFSKRPSLKSLGVGEFYTSKDKLWEFVDENTTGKRIEFRTKGQWKRHLKKIGHHDDIKQNRSRDEIVESIRKKSQFKPVDRQERVKTMLSVYDEIRRNR